MNPALAALDLRQQDAAAAPLWRVLSEMLNALFGLFGGPGEIAAQVFLTRRVRRELLYWLRAGENFLRALLLAAALKCAFAPLGPAPKASRRRPREKRVIEHHHNAPENWRVAFRVLPPPPRPARKLGAAPGPAPGARRNAWPLAERAEALLRAFNAPQRIVRRLARRVRRQPEAIQRISPLSSVRPFDSDLAGRVNRLFGETNRAPAPNTS